MTDTPISSLGETPHRAGHRRPARHRRGHRRRVGRKAAATLPTRTCCRQRPTISVRAGIEAAGGRALYVESDLADLSAHEPLIEAVVGWGGGLGRADRQCRNWIAPAWRPALADATGFRPGHGSQPQRNVLSQPTRCRSGWWRIRAAMASAAPSLPSASVSAEMASPERGAYCVSKAGLAMVTKLLALRLGDEGISVFEVRPGIVRSEMTAGVADRYDQMIAEGVSPIRRWGKPHRCRARRSGAGARRFRLRHRHRRPCGRRPVHPAALIVRAYDYVIVGAGPAGCCLAARLTEDPDVSVLLLEAGGTDRHPYIHVPAGFAKLTGTSHTWGYSTAPQREVDRRAMWYPQGRVLGGGSSINAMVYARGNAKDYDAWADVRLPRLVLCRRAALLQAAGGQRALPQRLPRRPAVPLESATLSVPCRYRAHSCARRSRRGCPSTRTSTARRRTAAATTR